GVLALSCILQLFLRLLEPGLVAVLLGRSSGIAPHSYVFKSRLVARRKAFASGLAVITELAGCCPRIEKGLGKSDHLLPVVDLLGVEILLQVINDIGVGNVLELRLVVVRREGIKNFLWIVVEIEDKGFLAGENSVQARQCLNAVNALEFLVHVHGAQFWLVKAGLVL